MTYIPSTSPPTRSSFGCSSNVIDNGVALADAEKGLRRLWDHSELASSSLLFSAQFLSTFSFSTVSNTSLLQSYEASLFKSATCVDVLTMLEWTTLLILSTKLFENCSSKLSDNFLSIFDLFRFNFRLTDRLGMGLWELNKISSFLIGLSWLFCADIVSALSLLLDELWLSWLFCADSFWRSGPPGSLEDATVWDVSKLGAFRRTELDIVSALSLLLDELCSVPCLGSHNWALGLLWRKGLRVSLLSADDWSVKCRFASSIWLVTLFGQIGEWMIELSSTGGLFWGSETDC